MLSASLDSIEARAAARLSGFPGFLHANGFAVGASEAIEVLKTAGRIGVLDRELLRWSLQALLCGRADEWQRFDELFDAWFLPANRWARPERHVVAGGTDSGDEAPSASDPNSRGNSDETFKPRRAASPTPLLESTDFQDLITREHLVDIEALVRRLARQLKWIRLRRMVRTARGRRLDLAATIRRSVASGGTPIELAWKDRRRVEPHLVMLIDVSRSMSSYSFFYLRLARALAVELGNVHSFIFHTHITAVTQALNDPDPWRAQEKLHLIAQGWAGGTQIGASLAQFNREHAARVVNSRSAVLILSDGYDTGDPQQLSGSLRELRRKVRRLVWLNPLSSRPGYAPVCQGMLAALPHLDLLAPAADLAALRAVLPSLIETLQ